MPYQTLLSGLQPPSPQLGVIEGFFGKEIGRAHV